MSFLNFLSDDIRMILGAMFCEVVLIGCFIYHLTRVIRTNRDRPVSKITIVSSVLSLFLSVVCLLVSTGCLIREL